MQACSMASSRRQDKYPRDVKQDDTGYVVIFDLQGVIPSSETYLFPVKYCNKYCITFKKTYWHNKYVTVMKCIIFFWMCDIL